MFAEQHHVLFVKAVIVETGLLTLKYILLQVDVDDVITKEEQIYVLFNAKRKCERAIKSKMYKVSGKYLKALN